MQFLGSCGQDTMSILEISECAYDMPFDTVSTQYDFLDGTSAAAQAMILSYLAALVMEDIEEVETDQSADFYWSNMAIYYSVMALGSHPDFQVIAHGAAKCTFIFGNSISKGVPLTIQDRTDIEVIKEDLKKHLGALCYPISPVATENGPASQEEQFTAWLRLSKLHDEVMLTYKSLKSSLDKRLNEFYIRLDSQIALWEARFNSTPYIRDVYAKLRAFAESLEYQTAHIIEYHTDMVDRYIEHFERSITVASDLEERYQRVKTLLKYALTRHCHPMLAMKVGEFKYFYMALFILFAPIELENGIELEDAAERFKNDVEPIHLFLLETFTLSRFYPELAQRPTIDEMITLIGAVQEGYPEDLDEEDVGSEDLSE